jgi:aldehyde:ferredoxin oxidoreductase
VSFKGGYFKRYLHMDLSSGRAEHRDLGDDFLSAYLGGRGFGAKLVWDNLRENGFKMDPLSPQNLLVIAPGPLTGVYLPSSGKNSFVSISPATGLYGDSSLGGGFGVELRQTGIDMLAITGRAETLSILFIDNDEVSVIPMPELKGRTCLEAEGLIEEKLRTHHVRIATIGIGGENLVRFACINADWSRNAGRTGMGAIMGSKNLKAIAVRGSRDLPVHDMAGLVRETDKAIRYMRQHKYFKLWQEQGLMNVVAYANAEGFLPAYNFKDSTFPRHREVNGETMLEHYKIGDSACFACPMCCGNICLVKNGKHTGVVTEGPEYESCAMLGPNLGIDNFAAVLAGNRLCDELGIDTISTGNIIGAVIEGYEKGIIALNELDGRELTWGNEDAVLALVRKIARREGVGDVLAGGSRAILDRWPGMDKVLLQVKGLEQSAYDSRASMSMGLAYATSDIGAHHTRAWTIAKELEEGKSWTDDEKIDIVIYHQTLRPLFDMLGVCRLPWIELGLNERHYERFYSCVTGRETTLEALLKLSNNVYDLTRLINTRLGVRRGDDSLPYKVHSMPALSGPNAGKTLDRQAFERVLSLYYRRRGWDENGVPPAALEEKFA